MSTQPSRRHLVLRLVVTVAALGLIALRMAKPDLNVDAVVLGLALVAILPWLPELIESASFPGGWMVKFREMQERQDRQDNELAALKFLTKHLLTDHELEHLTQLARDTAIMHRKGPTSWFLERELRHLRDLGFIAERPGRGIDTFFYSADSMDTDLRDHFQVTNKGIEYLRLLEAL